ncbi:hypothetical protein BED35_07395 [Yersinia enterocolitica]|uniref:hypothetical protein n=1 Tax=Yersinia enterocolitica TaxID=630 RepID=UPI000327E49E|nr:hypothetical protein [Yersinia enterocolitica]AOF18116.1 hypothetical protein BED34_05360 [Yersinia enterocolitica]AOF18390.1 hypothetical protein BED34_06945 [Yersinia enterocolitica]AOF22648.1 hypothetical protein BED33_08020 [Yersinia enterocolitica]AOF22921.1 hypothetical protein BED33_09605 [Yersinia enterocolitica]AOF26357.1 hypothetical protein BED32_05335 [Yersinia enterocolitica]
MKVNFYAVYAEDAKTKKKHPVNLMDIFQNKIIKKKNHAQEIDDYFVFAHHIHGECFLITKTNDSQLVQRINKKTLSIDEIKNVLNNDESLCYPSFLLIKDNVIGFANTLYGPRTKDLNTYISSKGELDHGRKLIIEALMRDVTKTKALDMEFIGRTTLRIESGSSMLSTVLRAIGVETIEEELLSGIEITIKPKRMRNISEMSKEVIRKSDDNHNDIHLKGKELAADILTDFYLSEKGHLSANLYKSSSEEIAEEMESCFIRMKPYILKSYKDNFENEISE